MCALGYWHIQYSFWHLLSVIVLRYADIIKFGQIQNFTRHDLKLKASVDTGQPFQTMLNGSTRLKTLILYIFGDFIDISIFKIFWNGTNDLAPDNKKYDNGTTPIAEILTVLAPASLSPHYAQDASPIWSHCGPHSATWYSIRLLVLCTAFFYVLFPFMALCTDTSSITPPLFSPLLQSQQSHRSGLIPLTIGRRRAFCS